MATSQPILGAGDVSERFLHAPHSLGLNVPGSPNSAHPAIATPTFPSGISDASGTLEGGLSPQGDKLEPIAVIGFSLRFPGDASSADSFWKMIMEGRSARSEVPKDRFNIDAFYRNGKSRTGTINTRNGHFIKEDIGLFDAPFFTMTPGEAECMDPMQRWLLETSYEALENAGIRVHDIKGSKTSVHMGAFLSEYAAMLSHDPKMAQRYKGTGTAFSMLSNRISWFYDLLGPSMSVDTACSSSLYALHAACQALRNGDANMGIVGGCNLFYNPDTMTELSDLKFLSPDGISYSFDHRANGYSRGEGLGVVIIKPLSAALRDGDTIRAVIRATGVNQDGRTPGITQPSSQAQQRLIRDTYEAGGLDMSVTRYFEAHGTGTAIGDPMEANAIYSAFKDAPRDGPLIVGAVKSNIGHLEGAAGMAGLIKAILALENGVIPPNTWLEKINPKIPAEKWNLKFPTEPTPWPTNDLRRASVNSFGFGGSNSHVIIDDAYNYLKSRGLWGYHTTRELPPSITDTAAMENGELENQSRSATNGPSRLFVWSTNDEAGIKRLSDPYLEKFKMDVSTAKPDYLESLAYTLSDKRSNHPWKAFAVAGSVGKLEERFTAGLTPIRSSRALTLGFIFTGQGAQWHAMGRELYEYPEFKHSLTQAEQTFKKLGCSWSLTEELMKDEESSRVSEPALSQPICTAIQIALIKLLRSWNVLPAAVIGHSSGEIAAAYCTGALSEESAWKVAFYRGLLAESLKAAGSASMAMMAVGMSETEMLDYLHEKGLETADVSVACINSNKSITMSGGRGAINDLCKRLQDDNIFARTLKVDVAYHSRYMNAIAEAYRTLINNIKLGTPLPSKPVMYSSVTGSLATTQELCDPSYWVRNMVSPVRFLQAVSNLCVDKAKSLKRSSKANVRVDHLVELGPHSTLQGPLKDILESTRRGKEIGYSSTLLRKKSAVQTALELAGSLYCLGYPVDIATVNSRGVEGLRPRMLTNLPAYPFNHSRRYWLESRLSKNFRFRTNANHELIGSTDPDWNPMEARWRHVLSLEDHPWASDHVVNGVALYPAAGMLVMAIEAMRQLADADKTITGYRFRDITFGNAIVLRDDAKVETVFHLRPSGERVSGFLNWSEFKLYIYEGDACSEACRGSIALEYQDTRTEEISASHQRRIQDLRNSFQLGAESCSHEVAPSKVYQYLNQVGLCYGPAFQTLKNIRYNKSQGSTAEVNLREWALKTDDTDILPHFIHPAALDTVLQIVIVALTNGAQDPMSTMVPTAVHELWLSATEEKPDFSGEDVIKAYTTAKKQGSRKCAGNIIAVDAVSGMPRITASIEITSVAQADESATTSTAEPLVYNLDWKPDFDILESKDIVSYCSGRVDQSKFRSTSIFTSYDKPLYSALMLWKANQVVKLEELPDDFTIHKFFKWMKHELKEENIPQSIPLSKIEELANSPDLIQQLETRVETTDPIGMAMVRVGRQLVEILRGKVNVVELLFNDDLMNDVYRYINNENSCMEKLKVYIDGIAHKKPDMKILEIGAGTGSATRDVIDALTYKGHNKGGAPRFAEYAFTDISVGFFNDAKEQFKEVADRMTFGVLDISKSIDNSGFKPHTYDLIIASNVLHATPDIQLTLQNARKLLKPGGKLIMYEIIEPSYIHNTFFLGHFAGWWLSSEEERQWSPLMSETQWTKYLTKNGFSGIDVSFPDFEDPSEHSLSVMIATAKPEESDSSLPQAPQDSNIRVIAGDSESQRVLAENVGSAIKEKELGDFTVVNFADIASTDFEGATCIFLPELETSILNEISSENFGTISKVINSAHKLLWVTEEDANADQSPTRGMVTGLRRTLANDSPNLQFATLSIPKDADSSSRIKHMLQTLDQLIACESSQGELEYRIQDGIVCISRLVQASYMDKFVASRSTELASEPILFREGHSRALKLSMRTVGALDTFQFVDDVTVSNPLGDNEVEIEVKATGLNFHDVVEALGKLPDTVFGLECAGIISRAGKNSGFKPGDRVCSAAGFGFCTYARCDARTVAAVPDHISIEEAAGLPVSFSTAYHAIMNLGRMQANESILIHSAAGGLGQACIQLAKLLNADIYATVGTVEKKEFLMNHYGIPEDHIFSSRSDDFVDEVKRLTNGRGVDVIINSLYGEGRRRTWDCIAPLGRFVETGLADGSVQEQLPVDAFAKSAMFLPLQIALLVKHTPGVIQHILKNVMKLAGEGKISVSEPLQVFNGSEIETAFRLLQSGKSKGKIVVKFNDDDIVQAVPSTLSTYQFDANATYVISGGLGGLGRTIATWMVERGARNLILLSRSGAGESSEPFLNTLRALGATVSAPACDISDQDAVQQALDSCSSSMPKIKGCIQSAMVLKDAQFELMTPEMFNTATGPKVAGSWNLHQLLPRDMDFFIMLSSSSGIAGWFGQANYAAGNTYQDALARHLVKTKSRKAISIDLSGLAASGFVANMEGLSARLEERGVLVRPISNLYAMLEYYCDPQLPMQEELYSQAVVGVATPAHLAAKGYQLPGWMDRPMFSHIRQLRGDGASAAGDAAASEDNFAAKVKTMASLSDVAAAICDEICQRLARMLAIDKKSIDAGNPMHTYGMDSLAAIEMRSWMKNNLGCDIAIFEILGNTSIEVLCASMAKKCEFVDDEVKKASA